MNTEPDIATPNAAKVPLCLRTETITTAVALQRLLEQAAGKIEAERLARYQDKATRINTAFGPWLVEDVSPRHFRDFLESLRDAQGMPISHSSRRAYIALFEMACREARSQAPAWSSCQTRGMYSNQEIKCMHQAVRPEERGFVICLTHLAIRRWEAILLAQTHDSIDPVAQTCRLPPGAVLFRKYGVIEGHRLDAQRALIPGVPPSVWALLASNPLLELRRPWVAISDDIRGAINGSSVSASRLMQTAVANYSALYGSEAAARICRCVPDRVEFLIGNGPTEAEARGFFDFSDYSAPVAGHCRTDIQRPTQK